MPEARSRLAADSLATDHAVTQRAPAETIRVLRRADISAIVAFIGGLDGEAQCGRFHCAITPAAVRAHYDGLDWTKTAVFGWFQHGSLRAVAEAHSFDASAGREAELAVIADPQMRRDLALDLLLICALPEARSRGAQRSWILLPQTDHAQQQMAAKAHAAVDASGSMASILH